MTTHVISSILGSKQFYSLLSGERGLYLYTTRGNRFSP
jgi:hypothetical protein